MVTIGSNTFSAIKYWKFAKKYWIQYLLILFFHTGFLNLTFFFDTQERLWMSFNFACFVTRGTNECITGETCVFFFLQGRKKKPGASTSALEKREREIESVYKTLWRVERIRRDSKMHVFFSLWEMTTKRVKRRVPFEYTVRFVRTTRQKIMRGAAVRVHSRVPSWRPYRRIRTRTYVRVYRTYVYVSKK